MKLYRTSFNKPMLEKIFFCTFTNSTPLLNVEKNVGVLAFSTIYRQLTYNKRSRRQRKMKEHHSWEGLKLAKEHCDVSVLYWYVFYSLNNSVQTWLVFERKLTHFTNRIYSNLEFTYCSMENRFV